MQKESETPWFPSENHLQMVSVWKSKWLESSWKIDGKSKRIETKKTIEVDQPWFPNLGFWNDLQSNGSQMLLETLWRHIHMININHLHTESVTMRKHPHPDFSGVIPFFWKYPLVMGKSLFLMGKLTINGYKWPFSIAMLVYQRACFWKCSPLSPHRELPLFYGLQTLHTWEVQRLTFSRSFNICTGMPSSLKRRIRKIRWKLVKGPTGDSQHYVYIYIY